MPSIPRRLNASIDIETLEKRDLLAAFGAPWPDARNLAISFPADGVAVGNYTNDLHETLDEVAERQQWEELVLRAYQTWAIHADINVGLRNDHDLDFGTPGLSTGDPRFGEFRNGTIPQTGLLASSLPFQSHAGTYSGDVMLNSNEQFVYHDWENQLGPDPATLDELDRDLFSLLLHESGNTLGLADNLLDWSVMFRQYTIPKGALAADDIAEIQALYGARLDPYEQVDNGQLQVASLIPTPVGFDSSSDVVRTRASLVNGTDVDNYKIVPLEGQGKVTIRLKAAGISLLQSRLDVLDEDGGVIATATSDSVFDNDNTLTINGLQSHPVIYVRVSALNPSDVYAVGDYELEIDYRNAHAQSSDPILSSYDAGADKLFANYSLIDDEEGLNDTVSTADHLVPLSHFSQTRYELKSSVSSSTDVDVWGIQSPQTDSDRLIISVAGVGLEQPELAVKIVDSEGDAIGVAGRTLADGTLRLEVAQPEPDHEYFVQIGVDPSSVVSVGNYVVTAEFTSPISEMNQMVSGEVSSDVDDFIRWTAEVSKLYRFDLTATNGEPNELVRLTIYDAHTQEVRLVLSTRSWVTRTGYAWLPEGDYILRFSTYSRDDHPVDSISYSLAVDGISDDQDDRGDPEDGNYYYYETDPPIAYQQDYYHYDDDFDYAYYGDDSEAEGGEYGDDYAYIPPPY